MKKEEEVKKKPATRGGKKKKEENKTIKIVVLVVIVIASMILGWLCASLMDNSCKVTFSVGNGLEDIVVTVERDNGVIKPANPEKDGYTFEGWYYDGVRFDFATPITKNITLTAIWSENGSTVLPTPGTTDEPEIVTYSVTFDSNGGSSVATQTIEENKLAVEPTKPTRSGYTFNGWYVGDAKYDFTAPLVANLTLTAKWTKNETQTEDKKDDNKQTVTKYTVKFNYGYSNKVTSKSVEKGKTVSKPSNPTRSGYTFLGWYYNGEKFDFSTKITKNITITAKWEKKDVITVSIVETNSVLGQQMVYVLKNGQKVAGTVVKVKNDGTKVTLNVPATGITVIKGTYKSITSPKVK